MANSSYRGCRVSQEQLKNASTNFLINNSAIPSVTIGQSIACVGVVAIGRDSYTWVRVTYARVQNILVEDGKSAFMKTV